MANPEIKIITVSGKRPALLVDDKLIDMPVSDLSRLGFEIIDACHNYEHFFRQQISSRQVRREGEGS